MLENRRIKHLCLCMLLMFSKTLFGKELSLKGVQIGFLAGYDAYLRDSYFICATEFESIQDSLELLPLQYQHRAALYQAYCNAKLKNRQYAAQLLLTVNASDFKHADKKIYNILINALESDMDKANSIHLWAFPYSGALQYSPRVVESSANLYGFYLGMDYRSWYGSLGFETYRLKPVNPIYAYTQTLSNALLGKKISKRWYLQTYFTDINATQSAKVSGDIIGLGLIYNANDKTSLAFDASYSMYPLSSLKNLSASQATVALTQQIYQSARMTFDAQVSSETIFTQSKHKTDPVTGFALKKSYQRWALGLLTYVHTFIFNVNGWTGSEALGVRNQGTLVFNGLKNYSGGYGLSADWHFADHWHLKAGVSRETYKVTSKAIQSTAYIFGLNITF